ncbi:MAG: hypothetical protein HRT61_23130 [Ekhidna sp.]|nr:hypothetical protein [Ekhidna sp.]
MSSTPPYRTLKPEGEIVEATYYRSTKVTYEMMDDDSETAETFAARIACSNIVRDLPRNELLKLFQVFVKDPRLAKPEQLHQYEMSDLAKDQLVEVTAKYRVRVKAK